MAAANFDGALARLLAHEGGYANHPADPGGPTKYGITRAVARASGYGGPMRDLPLADAKAMYLSRYWQPMRCDRLPAGVDYAVFDYAVNSGTVRAGRVLRALAGSPPEGGTVDEPVLAAVMKRDPVRLIHAVCDERLAFLKRLKTWAVFGRGWERRVAEVREAAVAMANGRASPAPRTSLPGKGAVPKPTIAERGTIGTGLGGAGAAALHWRDWIAAHPVAATFAAATVVALTGAVVFLLRRRRKAVQVTPMPVPSVPEKVVP